MTQEKIHEALCSAPDDEKMKFAISCQIYGIEPQKVESTLANVITGIENSFSPALEYYKYFGGK